MSALPNLDMGGTAAFDDTPTAELSPCTPVFATARNLQVEAAPRVEVTSGVGPAPGAVLRSRYVLEEVIGYGGTSIVFRARDLHRAHSGEEGADVVAIKLLRPEKRADPLALMRLKREFWQMQRLSHPCIVRVFDLDCDGEVWFITMELVGGPTARSWMDPGGGVADALKVIAACCEALEYAHRLGIVHGDVKPTNVMVANGGTVKLIDFGSASSTGRCAPAISDTTPTATPSYASPQILAGERADRRDDIFSVACLSYVILSGGRHPFGGCRAFGRDGATPTPALMCPDPLELFEVIERGLSAEREQRPASAREFLRNLTDADRRRQANASSRVTPGSASPRQVATASRVPESIGRGIGGRIGRGIGRRTGRSSGSSRRAGALPGSIAAVALAIIGAAVFLSGRHTLRVAVRPTIPAPKLLVSSPKAPMVQTISNQSLSYGSAPWASTPGNRVLTGAAEVLPQAVSTPALIATADAPSGAPSVAVEETKGRPRDFGVISFEAPMVHASAGQPLVAIGVVRQKATKSRGTFLWRVASGTSPPDVDPKSMKPQLVSFIEGQAVRMLYIPLTDRSEAGVASDARNFTVELRQVAGGPALGRYSRVTVVIDPPPSKAGADEPSNTERNGIRYR